MKEKKLVNLRALLILIVVFGHSIIIYSTLWTYYSPLKSVHILDTTKNIINYYQMYLFFSLSGYLFYYTCVKKKKIFDFCLDKIKRLLIPFFVVGLFYMVPIKMLLNVPGFKKGSYFANAFRSIIELKNTGHLWFLVTLFIIFIIFFILSKIVKIEKKETKYKIVDLIVMIVLLFIYLKASVVKQFLPPTALYRVFTYSFWFYLGFCLNKYTSLGKNDKAYKKPFVPYLCLLTGALFVLRINNQIRFINTLTTILVVLVLYIIIPSKTNKVTEYLDRNSMGMFLFHSPLIYISFTFYPNIHPLLMILINFVGFGFLASLITELIRKTPLKIIIGEYNKK